MIDDFWMDTMHAPRGMPRIHSTLSSRQIEESISILNFFPPNRGVDFYCLFTVTVLLGSLYCSLMFIDIDNDDDGNATPRPTIPFPRRPRWQ